MVKKNPITTIADGFCWVEKQITWVAFFAMLALMVVQVLCRYVLHSPLAWAEELIRYMYIAVSFLGAAIAVRESTHISINVLPAIVGLFVKHDQKKVDNVLFVTDILGAVVGFVFWCWMSNEFIKYDMDVFEKNMISVANQWPMYVVYMPVIISSVLMAFHYLLNIVEMILRKIAGDFHGAGQEEPIEVIEEGGAEA